MKRITEPPRQEMRKTPQPQAIAVTGLMWYTAFVNDNIFDGILIYLFLFARLTAARIFASVVVVHLAALTGLGRAMPYHHCLALTTKQLCG